MWNKRYGAPGYLFGTEPADFLRAQAVRLGGDVAGGDDGASVLCVADGEGRNSTYLAAQGHKVCAFDPSPVAVEKAKKLATDKGVSVDFHVTGIEDWDWTRTYDAVVGIFIQFAPPELRDRMFGWLAQAVAPGGLLLLHGYAPRQVEYGTGGPPCADNMYTTDMLQSAFAGFEVLRLQDYDAEISEGPGHSGRSALVDLVARKPV